MHKYRTYIIITSPSQARCFRAGKCLEIVSLLQSCGSQFIPTLWSFTVFSPCKSSVQTISINKAPFRFNKRFDMQRIYALPMQCDSGIQELGFYTDSTYNGSFQITLLAPLPSTQSSSLLYRALHNAVQRRAVEILTTAQGGRRVCEILIFWAKSCWASTQHDLALNFWLPCRKSKPPIHTQTTTITSRSNFCSYIRVLRIVFWCLPDPARTKGGDTCVC